MAAWHDDDAFWETFAPFMFTPDRWEIAPQEVDQIIERLSLAPGARVLDLNCGPGRHSLELARRGFRVTGVDRTAAYLARAREAASSEGLSVEFVHADGREFRRPEAFEAALNLFTSFGYFEDPADDRRVVENLFACLVPGGRLAIDLIGKEIIARIFQPRGWEPIEGGFILQERWLCDAFSWIENRWTIIRDGQATTFRVAHRLYSAAELRGLLASCGFTDLQAFGGLDGSPYDHAAKRLVLIAVKS